MVTWSWQLIICGRPTNIPAYRTGHQMPVQVPAVPPHPISYQNSWVIINNVGSVEAADSSLNSLQLFRNLNNEFCKKKTKETLLLAVGLGHKVMCINFSSFLFRSVAKRQVYDNLFASWSCFRLLSSYSHNLTWTPQVSYAHEVLIPSSGDNYPFLGHKRICGCESTIV